MITLVKACSLNVAGALAAGPPFADGMKVKLVKSSFVPSPNLVLADITLAAFTGSAPKTIAAANQNVIRDEETGGYGIGLVEPAGGLNFVCTAAPAEPETIYGYIITDATDVLMGSALLDQQKIISAIADFVTLPSTLGFFPAAGFAS